VPTASSTLGPRLECMTLEALEVLREEHRWIVRLLDALERVVAHARRSGRLDAQATVEILALFTHFADGLHQRREESCLFPLLLTRARDVEERLALARLCGQHERERVALRTLCERLLGAIYGAPHDLRVFLHEAEAFLALHRGHVAEEERQLLPHAERLLTAEDDEHLLAGFAALEREGPDPEWIGRRVLGVCERLGLAAHGRGH